MTDLLVRDPALGRALARALGTKQALLMHGHGAVVVGPSVPIVVRRSINLELNARLQSQAMALSAQITYLDPEEVSKIMAREGAGLDRAWELWKRKAMGKSSRRPQSTACCSTPTLPRHSLRPMVQSIDQPA